MSAVCEAIQTRERLTETKDYPSISLPINTLCYWLTDIAKENNLPIRDIQLVHPSSPIICGFEEEGLLIEWDSAPDRDKLEELNLYIDCSRKYGQNTTIFEMLDACQFIDFLLDNKLVNWSFDWYSNRKDPQGGIAELWFEK